jgi:hypothetical protein
MDKRQSKFYRLRRVSTTMTAAEYGRFIYIKHKPDFDALLEEYSIELPSEQAKEKLFADMFEQYWSNIGKMIVEEVEFKWGWRRFKSWKTSIRHPFSINHNKNPKWKKRT